MDEIPGWFGFRRWYDELAARAPDGAVLVELGVFCGKSLAHLARACGQRCRVVGVDTFLGSPEFADRVRSSDGAFPEWPVGSLAALAVEHLSAAGVLGDVTVLVSDSARAAQWFADGSVHAVLVDAGHDADSVERDIRAWWPKLAPGGHMAFDDFDVGFPGVREGCVRAFGEAAVPPLPPDGQGMTWVMTKSGGVQG